jgi:hypothetical protein
MLRRESYRANLKEILSDLYVNTSVERWGL